MKPTGPINRIRPIGTKAVANPNPPPWIAKVAHSLEQFPPTRRYLIGVSGGRDSVALLHLLHGAGYRKLIVCHLNHGLRGRSGNADEQFVKHLADQLGLKFFSAKVDVAALSESTRESIETAARHARYEFFAKAARANRCPMIFLAHHADDRVETFLFNLFRGAGPSGLGGMRIETRRDSLVLIRPLLGVWREQIDAFIAQHRLKFREDATNRDLKPLRNRLRHQILPSLEEQFGRQIRKTIWRTAEILSAEEEWLARQVEVETGELSVAKLREMPEALQRRMLHGWLKQHCVANVGFEEVERVRSLLPESASTAKVNLPGGLHARRKAGKLFLEHEGKR